MNTKKLTKNAFRLAIAFMLTLVTQKYTTFLFVCTCFAVKERYMAIVFTGVAMSLLLPSPYSFFNAVVYLILVIPVVLLMRKSNYSNVTIALLSLIYNMLTTLPKIVLFLPEMFDKEGAVKLAIFMVSISMYLTMYMWELLEIEVNMRIREEIL